MRRRTDLFALDPNTALIDGSRVKDWKNCPTPDCENKICLWAGTLLCHPCSVALLGKAEIERRYDLTHP